MVASFINSPDYGHPLVRPEELFESSGDAIELLALIAAEMTTIPNEKATFQPRKSAVGRKLPLVQRAVIGPLPPRMMSPVREVTREAPVPATARKIQAPPPPPPSSKRIPPPPPPVRRNQAPSTDVARAPAVRGGTAKVNIALVAPQNFAEHILSPHEDAALPITFPQADLALRPIPQDKNVVINRLNANTENTTRANERARELILADGLKLAYVKLGNATNIEDKYDMKDLKRITGALNIEFPTNGKEHVVKAVENWWYGDDNRSGVLFELLTNKDYDVVAKAHDLANVEDLLSMIHLEQGDLGKVVEKLREQSRSKKVPKKTSTVTRIIPGTVLQTNAQRGGK